MDHIGRQKKEIHPRLNANFLTKLLFLFTIKLFKKGANRDLEDEDLYEVIPDHSSTILGNRFETVWENQLRQKNSKNSVLRLLWTVFGNHVILLGVTQLISKTLIILLRPLALSKIIAFFQATDNSMTRNELNLWAGLLIGFLVFDVIYAHNYHLAMATLGIKVRAAFCSLIYRKTLKLSPERLGEISIGKIVNLITKDVLCLESFSYLVNDIWIAFINVAVAGYIIYRKVNLAALAGIAFYIIILPIQIYMASWATKLRMKMCSKVDERLHKTQETLSAIKIIKMYTWEKFFTRKIIESREKEIKSMHWIFYLKFIILQIGILIGNFAFYFLIITYKWLGNDITAETIYYIDTSFHILSQTLGVRFPSAISQIAEVIASIKRLGNVLKALEVTETSQSSNLVVKPKIILKEVDVEFRKKHILKSISLNVDMGSTLITGPVGSGKSFLLKTILQEFKPNHGSVTTQGRISFASQEPWLFPSSIKQNIIFGEKYDENRYQEVLRVCALLYDLDLLANGDSTIVEDRGNNLSRGQQARVNLARAVYKDSEIYLLDDCLSALDSQVSNFIFNECILKYLQNKLVIFVSHNVSYVKEVDHVVVLRHGAVVSHVKSTEINEKRILDDILEEGQEDNADDLDDSNEESKLITETTTERKVYQEVKKTGAVEFKIYKKYLNFGGGVFALIFIAILYGITQFARTFADDLMSQWINKEEILVNNISNATEEEKQQTSEDSAYLLRMYSLMIGLLSVFLVTRWFGIYALIKRASLNLHKEMITHMINAKMYFFDTNFIGNILNRFSKDLTIIDEHLPFIYHQVFRTISSVLGIITLIASKNPYFLIPTFVFFVILMFIRKYYLKTARSLKRLDATTRSPVVGHLNATLEGLTTIRAFKAESILIEEYDRHQDLYTSASYVSASSMRAFAFCLDMLCVVFIASIIARFLFWKDAVMAGTVGLIISQALKITSALQWGVQIWAEMENSMTSVERVLEYTEVKQESTQGQVLGSWPTRGEVKYENVYLSYNDTDDYVLRNINLTVQPQEKIGIVGRTGAGKSSIIATLFRLYEVKGAITIDGVNIKHLTLDFLRRHISIIPQDPVLFSGTVRDNIDPEGIYKDEDIWNAIETTYLKKIIPSLDFEITEGGSSFSVGQRQLICVARAIVRNNRIIVLDEATANMDPETDNLIHDTINKCFRNCTVFTIAHKLQSIINSDRIIVMDRGEIVESDAPGILLQRKDGQFYQMAEKAGIR